MMSRRFAVVALAVIAACRGNERAAVTIATTPDLAPLGLVQSLAQSFTASSKVPTRVVVTEERLIPELVRDGVADVVFTRSSALRQELVRGSEIRLRQVVAYDDYLLAGPPSDRARAKSARTATEALQRIVRRDRAFCSPADVPDLRHREAQLWAASSADPTDDRRYRLCRGSSLDALRESSRRGAYTLTDRATFERAGRDLDLIPIAYLDNRVEVLLPRPKNRHRNAEWFVQWVMSFRGRDVIERLRYDGERRFFVTER